MRDDVASLNRNKLTHCFLRSYSIDVLGRELIIYDLIFFFSVPRSANGLNERDGVVFNSVETSMTRPVLDLQQWLFRFFRPVFQSRQNSVGLLMISSLPYNGYLLFCGDKAAGAWC